MSGSGGDPRETAPQRAVPPPPPPPSAPPPPPGAPLPPPPGRSRRRRGVALGALVIALALAVGVGVVVLDSGGDEAAAAAVGAEPVGDPGADPFAEAIAVSEVDDLSADVAFAAATDGPVDGTTPELYGGQPDELLCDVDALAAALADPGRGAAWAAVAGVEPGAVADRLDALTPVLLTADTWVTAHGYVDGGAVPRQVVLQGGTAVLVDDRGTPAVKCANGSPLRPPVVEGATLPDGEGASLWVGYDRSRIVEVAPGTPVEEFFVVDVDSGEAYGVPVGGSIAPAGLSLRPDGLETVDFGADGADAVRILTELLGEPDRQRSRSYGGACRSTTVWWGWEDVNGDALVIEIDEETGELVAYQSVNSGPDPSPRFELATPAGLRPGDPFDAAAELHPGGTRATVSGASAYEVDGYVFSAALEPGPDGAYVEQVAAGAVPCAPGP